MAAVHRVGLDLTDKQEPVVPEPGARSQAGYVESGCPKYRAGAGVAGVSVGLGGGKESRGLSSRPARETFVVKDKILETWILL